jgi:hypothetical protein
MIERPPARPRAITPIMAYSTQSLSIDRIILRSRYADHRTERAGVETEEAASGVLKVYALDLACAHGGDARARRHKAGALNSVGQLAGFGIARLVKDSRAILMGGKVAAARWRKKDAKS